MPRPPKNWYIARARIAEEQRLARRAVRIAREEARSRPRSNPFRVNKGRLSDAEWRAKISQNRAQSIKALNALMIAVNIPDEVRALVKSYVPTVNTLVKESDS